MTAVVSIGTGDSLNLKTRRVSTEEGRMITFTAIEVAIAERTGAQGCQGCGELAWEAAGRFGHGVRRSDTDKDQHRTPSVFSAYFITVSWEIIGSEIVRIEKLHTEH